MILFYPLPGQHLETLIISISNILRVVGEREHINTIGSVSWESKKVTFFFKLGICILFDISLPHVGIYPTQKNNIQRNMYRYVNSNTIVANIQQRLNFSSMGEWLYKLFYINTMKYYAVTQNNVVKWYISFERCH